MAENTEDLFREAETIYTSDPDQFQKNLSLVLFNGEMALFEQYGNPEIGEQVNQFIKMDLATHNIESVDEYPLDYVAAGSQILMQDRYHYYTDVVVQDGVSWLRLMKLDLIHQQLSTVESEALDETMNPLVSLCKLNQDEFLLTGMKGPLSFVKRYNCELNTVETIIEEQLEECDGTIIGKQLLKTCVMNGQIYILSAKHLENGLFYEIGVYTEDGAFLQLISPNAIPLDFLQRTVLSFAGVNGYFILTNRDLRHAVYRLEGDQLVQVVAPGEEIHSFSRGYDNTPNTEHFDVILLRPAMLLEEVPGNTLIVLHCETGEWREIQVAVEEDYPVLGYGVVSENGDLMFTMYKKAEPEGWDQHNFRIYCLPRESLSTLAQVAFQD